MISTNSAVKAAYFSNKNENVSGKGRHNDLSCFSVCKKERNNKFCSCIGSIAGIMLYILAYLKGRAYAYAGGASVMDKYQEYDIAKRGYPPYTKGRVTYTVYDDKRQRERMKTDVNCGNTLGAERRRSDMRNNGNSNKFIGFKYILAFITTFLCISAFSTGVFAEGSADMLRSALENSKAYSTSPGTVGRTFIRNMSGSFVGLRYEQKIKVYVREGETIYLASSVHDHKAHNGDALVTFPNGTTQLVDFTESKGFIKTVGLEKKGPNGVIQPEAAAAAQIANVEDIIMSSEEGNTVFGDLATGGISTIAAGETTDGYDAATIEADQSGIYTFIFYTTSTPTTVNTSATSTTKRGEIMSLTLADSTEFAGTNGYQNTNSVAAFDVTVTDKNKLVQKGRAYMDYLSGQVNGGTWESYYIATRDGYIYKLNLNGSVPNTYNLFANNRGNIGSGTNASVYHSVKEVNNAGNFDNYKNLVDKYGNLDGVYINGPDNIPTDLDYSYHMFFNPPDSTNLPDFVLEKPKTVGKVTAISFDGKFNGEAKGGAVSGANNITGYTGAGGYFKVTTQDASSYRVIIDMRNMYVKKNNGFDSLASGHTDEIKLSTSTDQNFIYYKSVNGSDKWYSIQSINGNQHPNGGTEVVKDVEITKPANLDTEYESLGIVMLGNSSPSEGTAVNQIYWNGRDQYGRTLPAGAYFGDTGKGTVYAQAKSGEVHFPMVDFETIPHGLSVYLTNPPSDSGMDSAEKCSKLYYNNANDTLLRKGTNITPSWQGAKKDLDYHWAINQSKSGQAAKYENMSIDGISTYASDGKVKYDANVMLASDNYGVDHGISDTWTYILGNKVEMDGQSGNGGFVTLYSAPTEKTITGQVFFDCQDSTTDTGANAKYDKLTDDRALPQAEVRAYYGKSISATESTFEDDYSDPVTKKKTTYDTEGYYFLKTGEDGRYTIPINTDILNGGTEKTVKLVITYPDDAYICTTKNKDGKSNVVQYVTLSDTSKLTYSADVGYTTKAFAKPIRIQAVWQPEALRAEDMKISFDVKGYDEDELNKKMEDPLADYAKNPPTITPKRTRENVEVDGLAGNATTINDLPAVYYTGANPAIGEYGTETKLTYIVTQKSEINKGYELESVTYDPNANIGDGSTFYYNWVFTNKISGAKINETVYKDTNRNGKMDSGESSIGTDKYFKITKIDPISGMPVAEGFTVAENEDDETGKKITPSTELSAGDISGYLFPAGTYEITVDPKSEELIYCTNSGEKLASSTGTSSVTGSVDASTGFAKQKITIGYGETLNINVGFATGSHFDGTIFIDTVSNDILNGIMDDEEAPYRNKGMIMSLSNPANPVESSNLGTGVINFDQLNGNNYGEYSTKEVLKAVPYVITLTNPGQPDLTKEDKDHIRFSIPGTTDDDLKNGKDEYHSYTINENNTQLKITVEPALVNGQWIHAVTNIGIQHPLTVVYNAGAYHEITSNDGDAEAPKVTKTTKAWYADDVTSSAPTVKETDEDKYVGMGWAEINQEPGLVTNWSREDQLHIIPFEDLETPVRITRDATYYAVAAQDDYGNLNVSGGHIGDNVPDYKQVIYDANKPEEAEGTVQNVPSADSGLGGNGYSNAGAEVSVKFDEDGKQTSLEGYTFLGWAKDALATTPDYPVSAGPTKFELPDDGEILYAVWSKQYTVTYDLNADGGKPSSVNDTHRPTDNTVHLSGDTVVIKQLNRTDVVFTNSTGGQKIFVGWSTMPQTNFTLSQSNAELVETQKAGHIYPVEGNETITIPTEADWTNNKPYTPSQFVMPASNVTLYAMWADDFNSDGKPDYLQQYYTLTYNNNSADDNPDVPSGGTYVTGQTVPVDNIMYTGYKKTIDGTTVVCAGWSKTQYVEPLTADTSVEIQHTLCGVDIEMNENITLYAVFAIDENGNDKPDYSENGVSVDYYANKGTIADTALDKPDYADDEWFSNCGHNHTSGVTVNLMDIETAKSMISRENYVLVGWSNGDKIDDITRNDTRVHKDDSGLVTTIDGVVSNIVIPELKDKDNENIKVYAVWAVDSNNNGIPDYEDARYKVIYNSNTHGEATVPETKEYIEGDTVYYPVYDTADSKPKAEGVLFLGWSTIPDVADFEREAINDRVNEILSKGYDTGTVSDDVENFTMPASDVTYYAVWAKNDNNNDVPDYKETYTIRYDGNEADEGSNTPADETYKIPGEDIILDDVPYNGLNKADCVQIGWSLTQRKDSVSTKEEAEEAEILASPYNLNADDDKDKDNIITVYAVWAVDRNNDGTPDYDEDKYSIVYDMQGSSEAAPKAIADLISGDTVTLHDYKGKLPEKENAIFLGWSLTSDEADLTSAPAKDRFITEYTVDPADAKDGIITVYAVWAQDKYGSLEEKEVEGEKYKQTPVGDGIADYNQVVYDGNAPDGAVLKGDLPYYYAEQEDGTDKAGEKRNYHTTKYNENDTVFIIPNNLSIHGYRFRGWSLNTPTPPEGSDYDFYAGPDNGSGPVENGRVTDLKSKFDKSAGMDTLYAMWRKLTPSSISIRAWNDLNDDGKYDETTETLVTDGVKVKLERMVEDEHIAGHVTYTYENVLKEVYDSAKGEKPFVMDGEWALVPEGGVINAEGLLNSERYKVTYKLDKGNAYSSHDKSYITGHDMTDPDRDYKENHIDDGSREFSIEFRPSEGANVAVYGQIIAENSVTYNINNVTDVTGKAPVDEKAYLYNDFVSLKSNKDDEGTEVFSRDDAVFVGWSTTAIENALSNADSNVDVVNTFKVQNVYPLTEADKSKLKADDNSEAEIANMFKMPESPVTLYAMWAEDMNGNGTPDYEEDKYTVVLNYNGGRDADDVPVPETMYQNVVVGANIKVPSPREINGETGAPRTYKRYDKETFAGWSREFREAALTSEEENEANRLLSIDPSHYTPPGEPLISEENVYEVNGDHAVSGTITLYALWAVDDNDNKYPDYSADNHISYHVNGGKLVAEPSLGANTKDPNANDGIFFTCSHSHAANTQAELLSVELGRKNITGDNAVLIGWSKNKIPNIVQTKDSENDLRSRNEIVTRITIVDEDPLANTVYAVWAVDKNKDGTPDYDQYTVTYKANGGEGTPPVDEKSPYNVGDLVVVIQSDPPNDGSSDGSFTKDDTYKLTKPNAVFLGWSVLPVPDLSQDTKQADVLALIVNRFTMPNSNTDLYALWAADRNNNHRADYTETKYTLVYDPNNGEYGQDTSETPPPPNATNLIEGDSVPTPLSPYPGLERKSAVQIGWSNIEAAKNGTGNTGIWAAAPTSDIKVYKTNDIYNVSATDDEGVPDGTIHIYAVWAADNNGNDIPDYEEQDYTFGYDMNGTATDQSGIPVIAPSNVTKLVDGVSSVALHSYDTNKPKKMVNEIQAVWIGWSLTKQDTLYIQKPDDAVMLGAWDDTAKAFKGNYTVNSADDTDFDKTIIAYAVWAEDRNGNGIPDFEDVRGSITLDFNDGIRRDDDTKVDPVTREGIVEGQVVHFDDIVLKRNIISDYYRKHENTDKSDPSAPDEINEVFVGWSLTKYDKAFTEDRADEAEEAILHDDQLEITADLFNADTVGHKMTVYAVWADDLDNDGEPDYNKDTFRVYYYANGGGAKYAGIEVADDGQFFIGRNYHKAGETADNLLTAAQTNMMVMKDNAVAIGYSKAPVAEIVDTAEKARELRDDGTIVITLVIEGDPLGEDHDPKRNKLYVVWALDNNGNGVPDYEDGPFTVVYDPNGAEGGVVPTDDTEYYYGDDITVKDNEGSLTKNEAVFIGWSADKQTVPYSRDTDASVVDPATLVKGETIAAGSEIGIMDGKITLYAVWADDKNPEESGITGNGIADYTEKYDIVYLPNEGSGTPPSEVSDKIPRETVTIASVDEYKGSITRKGAVLAGWSHHKLDHIFDTDPAECEDSIKKYEKDITNPEEILVKDDLYATDHDYIVDTADVSDTDRICAFAVWAKDDNGNSIPDYIDGYYNISYDLSADVDADTYGAVTDKAPEGVSQKLADTSVTLHSYTDDNRPVRAAAEGRNKAVFAGWSLTKPEHVYEYTTPRDVLEEGSIYTVKSSDAKDNNITFYAVWASDLNGDNIADYEQERYSVTYNMGNHTELLAPVDDAGYLAGTDVTLMNVPEESYANIVFVGWTEDKSFVNGNDYDRDASRFPDDLKKAEDVKTGTAIYHIPDINNSPKDVTLYALWAKDTNGNGIADYTEKIRVHYEPNGGALVPDKEFPADDREKIPEDVVPVPHAPSDAVAMENAVHIGWSMDENVTDKVFDKAPEDIKVYGSAEPYTIKLEDSVRSGTENVITFYAVWAVDTNGDKIPDYSQEKHVVRYDMNGHGENTIPESEAKLVGEVVNVTDTIPKADGVVFLRWTTFAGVEDFDKRAHPGRVAAIEPVTQVTMPDSDVTLYAVWAEDKNLNDEGTAVTGNGRADYLETYTIKYNANYDAEGVSTPPDIEYVIPYDRIALEPAPYAGFTREGFVHTGWSDQPGDNNTAGAMSDPYIVPDKTSHDEDASKRVINAYALWETDEEGNNGPDGIPDAYQKKVTFHIENGTWAETGNSEDIIRYAELKKDGKWSADGMGTVEVPTPDSAYGYENGAWSTEPDWTDATNTSANVSGSEDITYVHSSDYIGDVSVSYHKYEEGILPDTYTLRDSHDGGAPLTYGTVIIVNPNGGKWTQNESLTNISEVVPVAVEGEITLNDSVREGYLFLGWTESENTDTEVIDYVYTAQWLEDANGDGIPDIYQKKVIFGIVNGTWENGTNTDIVTYVELKKDGKWTLSEEIPIPQESIPNVTKAKPDDAFVNSEGDWYPEKPEAVTGAEDVKFTYIYMDRTNPNTVYKSEVHNSTISDLGTDTAGSGADYIIIDPDGGIYENTVTDVYKVDMNSNEPVILSDPVRNGYVFMGWKDVMEDYDGYPDAVHKYKAQWAEDIHGDGGTSDGIPDMYQKAVNFKAVNGTWTLPDEGTDITRYAELTDSDNYWSNTASASGYINNIPVPQPDEGYNNGAWDNEPPVDRRFTGKDDVTFTYTYERIMPVVAYDMFNEGTAPVDGSNTYEYGNNIRVVTDGGTLTQGDITVEDSYVFTLHEDMRLGKPVKEGSVFLGWKSEEPAGEDNISSVYTAQWMTDVMGPDDKPDGVPDEYQKKITFHIVNGTWTETDSSSDIIRYVELKEDGKWSAKGTGELNVPEHKPDYGYDQNGGSWTDAEGNTLTDPPTPPSSADNSTSPEFTYTYSKNNNVHVDYHKYEQGRTLADYWTEDGMEYGTNILVDPNGGQWKQTAESTAVRDIVPVTVETNITLSDPEKREGYVFLGWARTDNDSISAVKYVYTAQWLADNEGPDGKPDNIPDIYQKKLEFRIVNGTWDGTDSEPIVEYVQLMAEGIWSENGTADISGIIADKLSTPQGKDGYVDGGWRPSPPPSTVRGTEDAVYTYAFVDLTKYNPVYKSAVYSQTLNDIETREVSYGEHIVIKPEGGIWKHDTYAPEGTDKDVEYDVTVESPIVDTINDPVRTQYVFMGWDCSYSDSTYTFTAKWEDDKLGNNGSDGIPDIYQKAVNFNIVNGTWKETGKADTITRYAELKDAASAHWSNSDDAEGTISNIPVPVPNTGYTTGGWNTGRDPSLNVKGRNTVTYIYSYDIDVYTVTYDKFNNYLEYVQGADSFSYGSIIKLDANGGSITAQDGMTYNNTVTVVKDTVLNRPIWQGHVFVGWEYTPFTAPDNAENLTGTYTARWLEDTEGPGNMPDGIPDKYQKTIRFSIIGGTWKETGSSADVIRYVELRDAENNWSEDGTGTLTAPVPVHGYGYTENGSWKPALTSVADKNTPSEFTYTFVAESDLTVGYHRYEEGKPLTEYITSDAVPYGTSILVDPNGGLWTQSGYAENGTKEIVPITVEQSIELSIPVRDDGYIFSGWIREENENTPDVTDYIYTAQWFADRTGPGDEPDGIPDIYEKRLEFRIVNGTWDGTDGQAITAYVQLMKDGIWSEEGTAEIPSAVLLKVSAPQGKDGYVNGRWYPDTSLPAEVSGSQNEVFTYIFVDPTKYNPVYKSDVYSRVLSDFGIVEIPYGAHVVIDPNGGTYNGTADVTTYDVEVETPPAESINDAVRDQYVFMGWSYELDADSDTHTFTAKWEEDLLGDSGSDGIPDKYEKAVSFTVVNGTWENEAELTVTRYAELKDAAEHWSDTDTAEGSINNIPVPQPNTGYTSGQWAPDVPVRDVQGKAALEYTYTYEIDKPVVSYNAYTDEGRRPPQAAEDILEYGDSINIVTDEENVSVKEITEDFTIEDPVKEGSVFMGWVSTVSEEEGIARTYTAQWMTDSDGPDGKPDGIPDEYQKKIVFHVVNGTWIDTSTDDIIQYYELIDPATGMWSEKGSGGAIKHPRPAVLYGFVGKWTPPVPANAVGNDTEEYTYTFTERPGNSVLYQSYDEEILPSEEPDEYVELEYGGQILIKPNGGVWTSPLNGFKYNQDTAVTYDVDTPIDTVTAPDERAGYIFMGWDVAPGEARSGFDYIFTAQWLEDTVGGTDVNGNDASDGIPDIYQKRITLRVVNGAWNGDDRADKTVYVELKAENDAARWRKDGIGTLVLPQGMVPDNGYKAEGWDVAGDNFTVTVRGNEPETYTYTFVPEAVTTPVEPAKVAYMVEHYLQQLDGTYVLDRTDRFFEYEGTKVSAEADSTYADNGYIFNEAISQTSGYVYAPVFEEGSTVPDILTLKLYYNKEGYRVAYDLNGGIGGPTDTELAAAYPEGSDVVLWRDTIPSSLTRDAAVFIGWSSTEIPDPLAEAPEEGTIIRNVTMTKDGVTVYAVWAADINVNGIPDYEEPKFSVEYDLNGGKGNIDRDENTYFPGEEVELIEVHRGQLTRDNAVFVGWSETKFDAPDTEGNAEITVVSKVTMLNGGVTVYAVWAADINGNGIPDYDEDHFTLTYNGNGNTEGYVPVDDHEYIEGTKVLLLSGIDLGLKRDTDVFVGWSTEQYVQAFTFEEKDEAERVILEGNSIEMPANDEEVFAVWAEDTNGNGKPDYAEDSYHVLYYANGGHKDDGSAFDNDLFYTCNHNHLTDEEVVLMDISEASALKYDDAILIGWSEGMNPLVYTREDYDNALIVDRIVMANEDVSVYAVWAADENHNDIPDYLEDKYGIEYDLNGGSGGPDGATLDERYLTGTVVTLWSDTDPSSMIRENAIFIGWSKGKIEAPVTVRPEEGTVVTEVTMVQNGVTVYAVWAEDINGNGIPDYDEDQYSLTYDGNGNTVGEVPVDNNVYFAGDRAVLQSGAALKKNDLIFAGWSTGKYENAFTAKQKAEADAVIIQGDSIDMNESVTLYAVWAEDTNGNGKPDYNDNEYTVVYKWTDDSEVPEGAVLPNSITMLEGMMFTPESVTSVSGYSFFGWYTDSTLSTKYTAGPLTSDITLYGKWNRAGDSSSGGGGGGGSVSPTEYTITADAGPGGSIDPSGKVAVSKGGSKTFTAAPDEGYTVRLVMVDGKRAALDESNSYTFENVTKDHIISVMFMEKDEDDKESSEPDGNTSEDGSAELDPNRSAASPTETGVGAILNAEDHTAYINGYTDGTFKANNNITRAEVAQIFYNLLLDKDVDITVQFSDVPSDMWYTKAVNTLASLDILAGVGENRFEPDRAITRAEFTAIAMRFAHLDTSGDNAFSDVDESAWYYDSIVGSIKYGWISGYNDGTFRPLNPITRAEVTAIVNRMLNRRADSGFITDHINEVRTFTDLANDHWAYNEVMEAANSHNYEASDKGEKWTEIR